MDLSHLLRSSDAHLRLDLLSPPAPRLADVPLRVPPGTLHPTLATSAFCNLLKFELERRHPHARRHPWPAEGAVERLRTLAPDLADPAGAMLAAAQRDLAAFVQERDPSPASRAAIAAHALRLGRLEAIVRSGYIDRALDAEERADDVAELLAMLDIVPWTEVGGAQALDLGPSFDRFADVAPETRADLVADGLMLGVKTAKGARVEPDDPRALLYRLILARAETSRDEAADVREIGVYFARHGHLWRTPVGPIVEHEAFPKVEAWFLQRLERTQRALAKARANAPEGEGLAPTRPGLAKTPTWVKKRAAAGKGAPARHEGKAEVKKAGGAKPPATGQGRSDRPAAPRPKAPQPPPREGNGPTRAKAPKPDWRKGSSWRKERGL